MVIPQWKVEWCIMHAQAHPKLCQMLAQHTNYGMNMCHSARLTTNKQPAITCRDNSFKMPHADGCS